MENNIWLLGMNLVKIRKNRKCLCCKLIFPKGSLFYFFIERVGRIERFK